MRAVKRRRRGSVRRVTLAIDRGAAGLCPLAIVRCIACSWPGTIDTMGMSHSGRSSGSARTHVPRARRAGSSETTSSRARSSSPSRSMTASMSAVVAPRGATANVGKPASTSASGPCWKSAAEYGSASTWASSLSLSAHSRAVAYSKPRPSTMQRSSAARSAAMRRTSSSRSSAAAMRVGQASERRPAPASPPDPVAGQRRPRASPPRPAWPV